MRAAKWFIVFGVLAATGAASAASLEVKNRSGQTICYVYVSACSEDSWGDDILGSETLSNGESASVRVTNGCWDLKAEDCDHAVVATRRGVQVSGNTSWTVGGASAENVRLSVHNRTGNTVCYIFVSACSSDSWGDDVLEESVLANGNNTTVHVTAGCWDLKAEDCDHNVMATRRNLTVDANTTWTIEGSGSSTTGSAARLRVRNNSSNTVCYVYVSACSSSSWGDDILEEDVLPAGQSTSVRVTQGCWDLKAEDCDHSVLSTRRNLQVESNTTWTLTD